MAIFNNNFNIGTVGSVNRGDVLDRPVAPAAKTTEQVAPAKEAQKAQTPAGVSEVQGKAVDLDAATRDNLLAQEKAPAFVQTRGQNALNSMLLAKTAQTQGVTPAEPYRAPNGVDALVDATKQLTAQVKSGALSGDALNAAIAELPEPTNNELTALWTTKGTPQREALSAATASLAQAAPDAKLPQGMTLRESAMSAAITEAMYNNDGPGTQAAARAFAQAFPSSNLAPWAQGLAEKPFEPTVRGAGGEPLGYVRVHNADQSGSAGAKLSDAAFALDQQGSFAGAIAKYDEALKAAPGDVNIMSRLGLAQKHAGDLDGAAKTLQAAVKADPSHGGAHYNLASVHAASDDGFGALDQLMRALEIDRDFFSSLASYDVDMAALRDTSQFKALMGE